MLHFVWFHNCDAHTPIPCRSTYSGQYFGFQTDNRCKLHFDWMIKRQQYWPLRYQQIGMYDVWGYDVVYSGKFIDEYEYKNNPWIHHGLHSIQDCFLSKGSYAYPSSVMIFLWSEICVEKFLCVWVNKTSEHTSWEKSTALKRLWSEINDWIWLHLFIKYKTSPSWHIICLISR